MVIVREATETFLVEIVLAVAVLVLVARDRRVAPVT